MKHAPLCFALMSLLLVACGGRTADLPVGDGGSDSMGGDDGATDAVDGGGRVPVSHRASATTCAIPAPQPEPAIPDAGLSPVMRFECHKNEDCTGGKRGVCVFSYTSPPVDPGGTRCVYDACESDLDCGASGVCTCGTIANGCTTSNCRIDSDCGPGGYCSPTTDYCGGGTTGYYCHKPTDECFNDSECTEPGAKCIWNTGSSKWSCQMVGCAAAGG